MSNVSIVDQLDENIAILLARAESGPASSDSALRELLAIAAELRTLPDPDFKACLKADLIEQAAEGTDSTARVNSRPGARTIVPFTTRAIPPVSDKTLPTLFGAGSGVYPIHRSSFIASALAHTTVLALLATVGIWAARNAREIPKVSSVMLTDLGPYILPPGPDAVGGGDRDKVQASEGNPPRFAAEQITPPAIVVRNEHPRVTADPTVVGPPSLSFPQTGAMGDPLASMVGAASNGSGSGGGFGSGVEGGVGAGRGLGVGPGAEAAWVATYTASVEA